MEIWKAPNSKSNTGEKEWSWSYHTTWIQTIPKSDINQNSMVVAENKMHKPMEKIENPEINPHVYWWIIFDKRAKNMQLRKESLFNKQSWENWKATWKRLKRDYSLSPSTKINSKWIKDLNIKPETIIYAGEKIGTKLTDQCIFLLLRAISWILFVAASNP